jgi:hypothetical protein
MPPHHHQNVSTTERCTHNAVLMFHRVFSECRKTKQHVSTTHSPIMLTFCRVAAYGRLTSKCTADCWILLYSYINQHLKLRCSLLDRRPNASLIDLRHPSFCHTFGLEKCCECICTSMNVQIAAPGGNLYYTRVSS